VRIQYLAYGGSANSILQFQLERGGDETKGLSEDEAKAVSSSWQDGKEA
jgi:hypothetical protein